MGGQFKVCGNRELSGSIVVAGNKNEALPVIAASLLTKEEVILENIPEINDTKIMLEIAEKLGASVDKLGKGHYKIKAENIDSANLDFSLCSKIRSSLLFVAPLMFRCSSTGVPSAGGDKIGRRRIDTHLLVFEKLGGKIDVSNDELTISLDKSNKADYILLDEASVMATENAIMLACVSAGETVIYNAACEPHVQGLCNMLVAMGAKIDGIGSNRLVINGVSSLNGVTHKILPDHIEAGSFIGLAAATGSEIEIVNGYTKHMDIILPAFDKLSLEYTINGNNLTVKKSNLKVKYDFGDKIPTIYDQPWPAFPADLTSIMVVTSLFAEGSIIIHEKMFESRMFFTDNLIRMGGKLVLCDPHRVVVSGKSSLVGIEMSSPDIRAGMALLIAALASEGKSVINNIRQIDRGYENIDARLQGIGANIERV